MGLTQINGTSSGRQMVDMDKMDTGSVSVLYDMMSLSLSISETLYNNFKAEHY